MELLRLDEDIIQENLNVELLKDYVSKFKNRSLENRVSMFIIAYGL
jgi:hypothetical protein